MVSMRADFDSNRAWYIRSYPPSYISARGGYSLVSQGQRDAHAQRRLGQWRPPARKALRDGWEVQLASAAVAKSMTWQPARAMAMVLAIEPPDVSWVWKCTGSDVT